MHGGPTSKHTGMYEHDTEHKQNIGFCPPVIIFQVPTSPHKTCPHLCLSALLQVLCLSALFHVLCGYVIPEWKKMSHTLKWRTLFFYAWSLSSVSRPRSLQCSLLAPSSATCTNCKCTHAEGHREKHPAFTYSVCIHCGMHELIGRAGQNYTFRLDYYLHSIVLIVFFYYSLEM